MAATKSRATETRKAKVRAQAADRQRRKRSRDARDDGVTRHALIAADDMLPRSRRKAKPDERRVASRSKRDRYSSKAWGGRLPNNDPTLIKFAGGRGINLYTGILHQFANVAGYCQAWVDHILIQDRTFKPAKALTPEDQAIADFAAQRAQRAWGRVKNRAIVLQKLLMGRFYGFARAEMVARYDEVIGEWIPDLYDVEQEAWVFDDDGGEFLVTSGSMSGVEVDPSKFVHFQWGSADTKYGKGDLSYVYLSLWKIQKLETIALQRIEDNESTIVVHIPKGFDAPDRTDTENAFAEEYRRVIVVPTEESMVKTEQPTQAVTTSGVTGRPEYESIRFHERWVQTMLLGAPQTGDKMLGTGKVEETRKTIWDDKTPLGSSGLDQTITESWLARYCDWNMADVRADLRPRCESDSADIAEGLSGDKATEARNIALDLVANRIPMLVAVELWSALGIGRARAQAIGESIVKERDSLVAVEATDPAPVAQEQEAA
jgi:hypothetical protein